MPFPLIPIVVIAALGTVGYKVHKKRVEAAALTGSTDGKTKPDGTPNKPPPQVSFGPHPQGPGLPPPKTTTIAVMAISVSVKGRKVYVRDKPKGKLLGTLADGTAVTVDYGKTQDDNGKPVKVTMENETHSWLWAADNTSPLKGYVRADFIRPPVEAPQPAPPPTVGLTPPKATSVPTP